MKYLTDAITNATDLDHDQAEAIVKAAQPLWEALENYGLVDGFGGAECERVLPIAIDAILKAANPLRYGLDIA